MARSYNADPEAGPPVRVRTALYDVPIPVPGAGGIGGSEMDDFGDGRANGAIRTFRRAGRKDAAVKLARSSTSAVSLLDH